MGFFNMLANLDPDKIVEKIESAERKLDEFIEGGNGAVDKVQGVTDKVEGVTNVLDKQLGALSGAAASSSDDSSDGTSDGASDDAGVGGADEPEETDETASRSS